MTEPKPTELYQAAAETLAELGGNGNNLREATIDEQSRQTAMARAMIENEKRQREQACGAAIDAAITAVLKKYKCAVKFMEVREGGQTTRIWLQPVAVDEPVQQG